MAEDPHTVSLAAAEEIDAYAETHLLRDPAVTEALSAAAAASASAGLPDIRVSQLQAMQLRMFVQAVGARRVLEVGTLGGYSAIAMASALPGEGRVVSLEISPHHAETAQNNLKNAGLSGRVEVRVGPAIERLDAMVKGGADGPFDFAFIDADKENIPAYLDHAIRLSRPGALIVVDNTVREGHVLDDKSDDRDVQGIRQMYTQLKADDRVTATTIQTVGRKGWDGYTLVRVS